METIHSIFRYLVTGKWPERSQHYCRFCDPDAFQSILYEDDEVIAIDNIRPAGQSHWLILPKNHAARDSENLTGEHMPLLEKMDFVKNHLLKEKCPDLPQSHFISGYHRGRRAFMGNMYFPDIISIQHIHLHVIIQPYLLMWLFKYPPWLPLMFKSDIQVLEEVKRLL